jgi:ABC-type glycerol-3-phosphate transport system substrate-binding protein
VLTNVFRGTEYPLPDGWSLSDAVPPVYDPAADTVRCLAFLRTETENGDGTISFSFKQRIFLLTPNGPAETEEVPESFLCGTFADDGFWCLAEDYADKTRHVLLKHAGETVADLTDSLDNVGRYVRQLRADDGGFLVLTEGAVTAYTGEGAFRFAVNGLGTFLSLVRDGNGIYWAQGHYREGHGIVPVDLEARSVGNVLLLPQDVTGICTGADGFLYGMARDGICRLMVPESGEIGGEIMADFLNSSIDGPNAALLAAADRDTFLLRVSGGVGTASKPVLYRRAPDIDLAQITTLELAHAFPLDASLRTFIAAYNRSHADCRILVADYSDRNTDDDPLAGANALAFAIAAGTDRPDLVIGVPGAEDVGLLIRKSLCADLTPFLKQDDFLTPDNVFGVVKTAYAAGGKLWGLPLSFTVSSLYSTRDILGSLADGDGWSVGELLDFAESLPSDARLLNGLSRENAADSLLGPSGYRLFLDRKRAKCTFDNPEFLRWLNFLASFPSYRDAEHIRDNEQLYGLYHTGKIALAEDHVYDYVNRFRRAAIWGTDNAVRIGYPSENGDGAAVTSESVFLLTRFSASPEAAWDFIRFCFRENEERPSYDIPEVPALKSTFDKAVSRHLGASVAVFFNGSLMTFDPGPDDPASDDELDQPGILRAMDEESAERMKEELDLPGFPIGDALPLAVAEIIEEEISVFLSGAISAEDCAGRIQSRAAIWLAENK